MKKAIWQNYFDIVILPPTEVSEYARRLSQDLRQYGIPWTLGRQSFIPHISLYHVPVKPQDFGAFATELNTVTKHFTPGYLRTTIIEPNFLMFDKPLWLQKLYLKIVALPAFEWIRNGNSRGDHPRGNGLGSDVSLVFSTGCLRRGGSGAGTVGNAGACGGRERFPSAAERRGR